MREERLKILSMLQEGKITPEEAERLLSALSGHEHEGPGHGPGRRPRAFWDFDFDFTRPFEHEFRRFGSIFDEDFRRKFQEKARHFRHSMRWADEDARREAKEAFREAAESIREAMEGSHLKETVEGIGKTVFDTMETLMRRFSGEKTTKPADKGEDKGATGEPRQGEAKPADDDKTQTV